MLNKINYRSLTVSGMALALITSMSVQAATPSTTQVGRYLTVSNKPTNAQRNPLLAVATFHFPPKVLTIGQAINVVLDNTSYRLVDEAKRASALQETLTKSLPITDRILGPMTIQEALQVLIGVEVFDVVVDPLHREINFSVKPRFMKGRVLARSLTKMPKQSQAQYNTVSTKQTQGRAVHKVHKAHFSHRRNSR